MRHLRLTEEQETKLVTYLKRRMKELDADNRARIDADKKSDLDYENSKDYRARLGTVFAESNMSVPLTSWVVDHFSSKTEEEVFSRDPMAHFAPEGPADVDTARGLDRFANYKLFKLGNVRDDLLDSLHSVFRHRAQILKATYEEDIDTWEEHELPVLHDAADQQPVQILGHGLIIDGRDKFLTAPDVVTGQPVQQLEADPTFILDPTRHFWAPSPAPVRFQDVRYAGPRSLEVDSDCFRAPNDARSLDECDILEEFYDKPIHWVRERFLERPWINIKEFEGKLGRQDASRKTDDERKKQTRESKTFDLESASIGIVEFWLERDVLGWGTPQRIAVWMDKKTNTLIDYEYQKKVTPDGRHPYTAIAIAKTKKYWWGKSIPEMLIPFQDYIDLQWNRHSFRNSINSNPIIGQNPNAIKEQKTFYELKPYDVCTLEDGKTMQDWLQAFVFPNSDTDTESMIDKAIYWVNFWLGISPIAQGDYSDVPQNTTLGGQEATLRESSKLSRRWTRRLISGMGDHLTKLAEILVATMDMKEAFTYLEGDQTQMGFLTKEAVHDLLINAKIIIAKDAGSQTIQESQLTLQIIERYFGYPPQIQVVVRPILKVILFVLGHDDVDALLPVPMMPMAPPPGAPMDPGATAVAPDATGNEPGTQVPGPAAAEGPPQADVVPFNPAANGSAPAGPVG